MRGLSLGVKIGIGLGAGNRLYRLRHGLSAHRARNRRRKGMILGHLRGVGIGEARNILRTRPAGHSKVGVLRLGRVGDAIGLNGRLWSRLRL